jgi:secreted trypsin-like serine protease
LILGGVQASEKEYPWLVAHYHSTKGFICGGSLVSKKIVVTAAHCIWNKNELYPISEYESTYYMGKYRLKDLHEKGYVNSDVQKFFIHENWSPKGFSYDSDIGISVLQKTIEYTEKIIPICVWTNSNGHDDLVTKGKRGYVAGKIISSSKN